MRLSMWAVSQVNLLVVRLLRGIVSDSAEPYRLVPTPTLA